MGNGLSGAVRRMLRRPSPSGVGPQPLEPDPAPDSTPVAVPGTRELSVDSAPVLAHEVSSFRASAVLAEHAALVADALEAAGVAYVVVAAETQRRRVLMVELSQRDQALSALREALAGTATYVGVPRGAGVKRPHLIEDLPVGEPVVLRVFRFRTGPGRLLSGPETGCDLQFWARVDDASPVTSLEQVPGALLGPRTAERVPDLVPPDQQDVERRTVDGVLRPRWAAQPDDHLLSAGPPIDAVYTWVDGADPRWRERKAAALHGRGIEALHATAAHDSRYDSHDELRYSLRSLDMYADWIHHVWLVTDDQVPSWLATEHPELTVVSHRELFGSRGRLPTFNSHAIETQLHHIDGLAEHYLYLNDDVFFGRPVEPSTFVLSNGISRFFTSTVKISTGAGSPSDRPYTTAAKNSRALIERRFGATVTSKFQHTPHALRRSVLNDLEADFGAEVAATAAAQFRGADDVSVSAALAHYYGYATGRSIPGKLSYAFVDLGRAEASQKLTELLERRDVDVFCINDNEPVDVDAAVQVAALDDFLQTYFPFPSPYEN